MPKDILDLPVFGRDAFVRAESVNEEARTAEVVWTKGAKVRRRRWFEDDFDEELVVSEEAIRTDRLNNGAPFLNSHNPYSLDSVLGVVVDGSVRIENGQGIATIRFSDREDVEPIWRDIKGGIIRNVSVGYRVHRFEIEKRDGEVELWRAVDWEPLEISAVAIGADPEAQFRSAEGQKDALQSCVVIRHDDPAAGAAIQEEADMADKRNEAGGAAAAGGGNEPVVDTRAQPQAPAAPAPQEPAVDADAVRAEERTRVSTIMTLCERHGLGSEFSSDLVARGVSLDEARSAILDKLVDQDPDGGRVSEPAPAQARSAGTQEIAYRDAMSSALMHRHNPGQHELIDGARDFMGLSLMEMARGALERRGISTRGMSKMEVAGAALSMRSTGAHSTADFPAILANVANKTLRGAYASTPRTFQAWARRAVITDFKPVSRAQLGGAPDLKKVSESGEFQYGSIGEGKENYALATYGRIVSVTRQVLINDDLDAFTRIPAAFGAAAADLESDIVYAILTGNPAMGDGKALFHADHNNLLTAAVVSEAALAAAYRKFGQQKGIEDRPVSIQPRFIIVPPGSRSVEARKQITATTPSATGDVNTFAGRLEVVEEARLIPASGQDPWFLAADPSRVDTVEFAYLDGQEGVYTETRSGFEVDGLEIKARHDFAAKAIDWRGMSKNPGAAPA